MANTNFTRKRGNGKCPTTQGKVARVRSQNFLQTKMKTGITTATTKKKANGWENATKAKANISQAQNQGADSSVRRNVDILTCYHRSGR